MTDLPELMRQHAEYMDSVTDFVGSPDAISRALRQGADEIKRLREEIGRLNQLIGDQQAAAFEMAFGGYEPIKPTSLNQDTGK